MAMPGTSDIEVHQHTRNPDKAWREFQCTQKFKKLKPQLNTEPKKDGHTRFVCISDTHSKTHLMRQTVPDGDVLLHAGDFTRHCTMGEIDDFSKWLGNLPHERKIVIAGNHEMGFEPGESRSFLKKYLGIKESAQPDFRSRLKNCTYLEDQETTALGFRIYGSPWQPRYHAGAFNLTRGQELLDKWDKIPQDTDILLTHSPPLGHGDESAWSGHAGCVELLTTVQQRVKPKYHVFGHIHEGYGMTTDGTTIFINAAVCDRHFKAINEPIVFDLPNPNPFVPNYEQEPECHASLGGMMMDNNSEGPV